MLLLLACYFVVPFKGRGILLSQSVSPKYTTSKLASLFTLFLNVKHYAGNTNFLKYFGLTWRCIRSNDHMVDALTTIPTCRL